MIIYPYDLCYWHDGAMHDIQIYPMQQSMPQRVQQQTKFVSLKKRDTSNELRKA